MSEFLIMFREVLEGVLVVGILYTFIVKTGKLHLKKSITNGIVASFIATAIFAVIFQITYGGFEGKQAALFEGTTMLIAAFLLSTMIIWMGRNKNVAASLEKEASDIIDQDKNVSLGLFALTFFAIFREGVEVVLFMYAILMPEIIISHVLTTVGKHYFANSESENSPSGGSITSSSTPHLGEVVVVLTPADSRWGLTGAYDVIDKLRSRIGTIPGVERLNYSANIFTAGKSIHFEFSGDSFKKLNQVVADTRVLLSGFAGVYDLADTDTKGKNELQIELLPSAEVYGITAMDIARQVRQAFFGEDFWLSCI